MKTLMLIVAVLVGGLAPGPAMAAKRVSRTQVSGVVNLNTATAQQLDQLPGVGEKAAKRIVDYRTKTPFTRAEELVKVKGFGKKKFEKLKANLAVSGPTTIKSSHLKPEAQGRTPSKH
jgi:competence protein ComEA